MRKRLVGVALLVIPSTVACQMPSPRMNGSIQPILVRKIVDEAAVKFENPQMFGAWSKAIVLYDVGGPRLTSLSFDGNVQWRVGRRGAGPGEFGGVTSVFTGRDGRTFVMDAGNARYSVWSPTGNLLREVRLPESVSRLVASSVNDEIIGSLQHKGAELLARFDTLGRRKGAMHAPAGIDTLNALAKELHLTRLGSGKTLVVFYWSSRMIAYNDNGSAAFDAVGIDSVGFPSTITSVRTGRNATMRLDPKAKEVTSSACDIGSEFLVLSSLNHRSGKIVDRYAQKDGRYLDSFFLPQSVTLIACDQHRLFALESIDEPAVLEYRLTARAGASKK